jgi:hypothetical protein
VLKIIRDLFTIAIEYLDENIYICRPEFYLGSLRVKTIIKEIYAYYSTVS